MPTDETIDKCEANTDDRSRAIGTQKSGGSHPELIENSPRPVSRTDKLT